MTLKWQGKEKEEVEITLRSWVCMYSTDVFLNSYEVLTRDSKWFLNLAPPLRSVCLIQISVNSVSPEPREIIATASSKTNFSNLWHWSSEGVRWKGDNTEILGMHVQHWNVFEFVWGFDQGYQMVPVLSAASAISVFNANQCWQRVSESVKNSYFCNYGELFWSSYFSEACHFRCF